MGHPDIRNSTAFEFLPLHLAEESGRPIVVTTVKASYEIDRNQTLRIAEEQSALIAAGEYWGDAESSSYKYEPECAFTKPTTDVVLVGHAHSPQGAVTTLEVGLRVGPVQKIVRVVGDRLLVKRAGAVSASRPKPFETMPLTYERAFGGWDRTHPDPGKHGFEPRNPVGRGFRLPNGETPEPIPLPNIEDRDKPWKGYGDRPPPAGFGFIGPNWEPRVRLAGTYDAEWERTRKPLLAKDFDRRYFNAASPGLVAPAYLGGDEPVTIVNASARGRLDFRLPGVPAPRCAVETRGARRQVLQTHLDTVIINTDEDRVYLIWRQHMVLPNGPEDVVAIEVGVKDPATAAGG